MPADRKALRPKARPAAAVSAATVPLALLKAVMGFQTDDVAVALADRSLRFIAVNDAWLAMVGLAEADLVGRTPSEVFGEIGVSVEENWKQGLAGHEVIVTFESPLDRKLRQVTVRPWRDGAGEICGVMSRNPIYDKLGWLTEYRERRQTLAMKMAKIYAFEVDFRTGDVSHEPPGMAGFENVRLHSFEDVVCLLPEADRDGQRRAWEAHLATGAPMIGEYRYILPEDGAERWELTATEAIRDINNEVVGLVGMTQVIDDRKRAELALVAEKEAAQAANRSKTEFLANISHEIRTPLNGVLGLSSLLGRTELTPHQSEMVRTIETSALTLNALLSDVLDLAKIESGRLELDSHPFDPAELVAHVHHLFEGAAAGKKLSFTCHVDPDVQGLVVGDRTRLSQILTNLTSNAIKFTASGAVTIRAWMDGEGGGRQLCVAVSDSGLGISEEVLGRLFERFVQADGSISRSFGGTGLGLAISRTLARLMGGDVEVVSELGRGSTFTVRMPAARWLEEPAERGADGVPVMASLPPDRPVRVLLVEDHPVNRRVVELILGDLMSLDCAENGAEGLAAFKQSPYDVVLMDMQMPVMDGLEATREIRAFERAEHRRPTPIVILSANAMSEHVRSALEAGADAHLAKPITADDLVSAVVRALESSPQADMSSRQAVGTAAN